jgi:hypothetical protein
MHRCCLGGVTNANVTQFPSHGRVFFVPFVLLLPYLIGSVVRIHHKRTVALSGLCGEFFWLRLSDPSYVV